MAADLTTVMVTHATAPVEDVLGTVGRALQGGLTAVIVRRPHANAREVYDLTRQLRPATRRFNCRLIVNDRLDVALTADADGVHLGERSIPIAAARRILRADMLLGCSTHDFDAAARREKEGADYVLLGSIFPTSSHPGEAGIGTEHLREAVLRTKIPVVAIGGIDPTNVRHIVRAAAAGAAAISAYSDAPDPAAVARALRAAFAR